MMNNPTIIEFRNIRFKISTNNFYDKTEIIWHCMNRRKTKNKPKNKFLKDFKNWWSNKLFTYYLKLIHSQVCLNLNNDLIN